MHHKAWKLFEGHHYLNASINKSAHVYVAMLNDEPVAICACLPFPHPKLKNCWKEHRTVVLPDYQGIGIGNILSETIAERYLSNGKRYISTTSHPAMINHRLGSKKWRLTKKPKRNSTPKHSGIQRGSAATHRLTAAFEYVGE